MQLIKDDKLDLKVENVLYYAYFIHQFSFLVSVSTLARDIESIYKAISAIMIFTFLIIILGDFYYFLRGKFSLKEISIYAIIAIVFLISFFNYRNVMVLANLVLISCFKNVNIKRFLKCYLMATVAGSLTNILLFLITGAQDIVIETRYGIERKRYGIGFAIPTFLAHYFYSITFMYISYKEKLKNLDCIVIMIINTIIFLLTDTKAVFLYIIMLLIIEYMLNKRYNKIFYKTFGIFTLLSYIICGLSSFLLSYFYDESNKVMTILNKVLSGRLKLMHRGLVRWGFTLFGQTIPIKETGNTIDSSMVSMIMENGLVVFIICITFMTILSYIAYKKKYIPLLIALFAIAIRSAFDLGFMALQFGPAVILFYTVLDKNFIIKRQN